MKKQKLCLGILIGILLLCGCIAAGTLFAFKTEKFELAKDAKTIWLDRYEERNVSLKSGDAEKLSWRSSDKKVVTVEDGRLSAQGVGNATVTVSSGFNKKTIKVQVNDSGSLPTIACDDFDAYQDAEVKIPAKIKYNAEITDIKVDYTAEIIDTSVAKYEDGKIQGVSLGKTQAVIRTEYKGLKLEKNVKITVKENSLLEFETPEIEISCAKGNAKLNSKELEPKVVKNGKILKNPDVEYKVLEGVEFVAIEDGKVVSVAEGTAKIEATYKDKDVTLTGTLSVKVKPNWVASGFKNESSYTITWQPAQGTIGGRDAAGTDMMEYRAAKKIEGVSHWEYRVSARDTGTMLTELYRQGYRYFAYDIYYGSNEELYLGTSSNSPQSVGVGEYFRRDYMKMLRDVDGDGKLDPTNRVEKNTWMTCIFDLKELIDLNPTTDAGFFFTVNDANTSSYIMNVRYYLDDAIIPVENLSYTDKEDYIQATNDEFSVAIPVSYGYKQLATTGKYEVEVLPGQSVTYGASKNKVDGRTGVYCYQANSDNSWINNLVLVSSMNKTYDIGLLKLSKLGNCVTFDIYIENATKLNISMNHTVDSANISVGKTDVSKRSDWLHIYKDGKLRYTIEKGGWYTVCIDYMKYYRFDAWRSSIFVGTSNKGDVFYIDNVRFYDNTDFLPTQFTGIAPPRGVETLHPDTKLESVTKGTFAGTIKFTSKNSGSVADGLWDANHWASIRFTDVTDNNSKGGGTGLSTFFDKKNKYKYIKLDIYLAENTTGFSYFSWATYKGQNGVQNTVDVMVGEENFQALLFDAKTKEYVVNAQNNKWYTLFIPVEYTGTEVPDWALIELRTLGGSAEKPSVMYLKNLEYTKKAYSYEAPLSLGFNDETRNVAKENVREYSQGLGMFRIEASEEVDVQLIINKDKANPISLGTLKKQDWDNAGRSYMGWYNVSPWVNKLKIGDNTITVRATRTTIDGKPVVEKDFTYNYKGFLYVDNEKHSLEVVNNVDGAPALKFKETGATEDIWNAIHSYYVTYTGTKQGYYVQNGIKYITMDVKITKGTGFFVRYTGPNEDNESPLWAAVPFDTVNQFVDNNGVQGVIEKDKWVTVKIPLGTNGQSTVDNYREFAVRPLGQNGEMYIRNVQYHTDAYQSPSVPFSLGLNDETRNTTDHTASEGLGMFRIEASEAVDVQLIINDDEANPINLGALALQGWSNEGRTYMGWYNVSPWVNAFKIGDNKITVRATRTSVTGNPVEEQDFTYNYKGFLYVDNDKHSLEVVDDVDGAPALKFKETGATEDIWNAVHSYYVTYTGTKQGYYVQNGIKYITMEVKVTEGTGFFVRYTGPGEDNESALWKTVLFDETSELIDSNGFQGKLLKDKWVTVKIPLGTNGLSGVDSYREFAVRPYGHNGEMYIRNVQYHTDAYQVPIAPLSLGLNDETRNTMDHTASQGLGMFRIEASEAVDIQLIINGDEENPINLGALAKQGWSNEGRNYMGWYNVSPWINAFKIGDNKITVRATRTTINGNPVSEKDFTYSYKGFLFVNNAKHSLDIVDDVDGAPALKFKEIGATEDIWNAVWSYYVTYNGAKQGYYVQNGIKYMTMEVKVTEGTGFFVRYTGPGEDNEFALWNEVPFGTASQFVDNNGVQGTIEKDTWVTIKIPLGSNGQSNVDDYREFAVRPLGQNGEMYIRNVQYHTDTYQAPVAPVAMVAARSVSIPVSANTVSVLDSKTVVKRLLTIIKN